MAASALEQIHLGKRLAEGDWKVRITKEKVGTHKDPMRPGLPLPGGAPKNSLKPKRQRAREIQFGLKAIDSDTETPRPLPAGKSGSIKDSTRTPNNFDSWFDQALGTWEDVKPQK